VPVSVRGACAARRASAAAALVFAGVLAAGCAASKGGYGAPSQGGKPLIPSGVYAKSAKASRAEARFAAGVAMDLEAQRLEELFTYQRLSRGTRQPSLLRDARGFREEALKAFDEAEKADPTSAIILRRKGEVLVELGRADEGLALYKRADEMAPAEARWYFSAANEMQALNRMSDAAELLERAPAAADSAELKVIAWLELGVMYTRLDRLDDAARVYRLALSVKRLHASDASTPVGEALASKLAEDPTGVRRLLVEVLMKQGKLDKALREAKIACESAGDDARPLASLVSAYLAQGNKDAAVDAAEKFVAANPSSQAGVLTLVQVLAAAGRIDDAAARARDYTAAVKGDVRVRQEMFGIYRDAGRFDDAEKFVLDDPARDFPPLPVAVSLLDMYAGRKEKDKAFDLATKILEKSGGEVSIALQVVAHLWVKLPAADCGAYFRRYSAGHADDLRVMYGYGEVLKGAGKVDEAGKVFLAVAGKECPYGDAYEGAAKYLSSRGENARAIELFLNGVEGGCVQRPEASTQSLVDGVTDSKGLAAALEGNAAKYKTAAMTFHEIVAALYLQADMAAKAEGHYREALKAPDPSLADYAGLAIALYRQDKTSDAIALVEDLMKKGQGAPPLVRMLVSLLGKDRKFDEARQVAQKLIDDQPTDIDSHLALVNVYVDEENFAAAERELLLTRELAEGDEASLNRIRYMLGVVYEEQGRDSEAVAIWRDNLRASPDDAESSNALGYHFADKGTNLEEARTLVEKAMKSEPDNSAYLDSLGWVYYKMNNVSMAVETLRKAAAREKDPVIYDHLGDALLKAGDKAGALDAWKRSLQSGPREKDRKKIVEKIQTSFPEEALKDTK